MEFDQSFSTLFIKKAFEGEKTDPPAPAPTPAPEPTKPSSPKDEPSSSSDKDKLDAILKDSEYKIVKKEDQSLRELIQSFINIATQKGKSGDVARDFILQKKTNIEQITALVGPDDAIKYYKDFVEKNGVSLENTFKIFETAISCSYSSGTNLRDILDFGLAFTVANRDPATLNFIMDETCNLASINPNVKPFQILTRAISGGRFEAGDSTFFKYDNPLHSAMLNRLMSLSVLTRQTDDVLQSDEAARIIEGLENTRQLMSVERDLNNYLIRGDYAKTESDNINNLRSVFKASLNDPFAQALRRMFFLFDMGQNVTQQLLQNTGISSVPESKKFGPKFQKKSNNYNIRTAAENESSSVPEPKAEDSNPLETIKKLYESNVELLKNIKSIFDSLKNNINLAPIVKPIVSVLELMLNFDNFTKKIKDGSINDILKTLNGFEKLDTSGVQKMLGIVSGKQSSNKKFTKVAQLDLSGLESTGGSLFSSGISGLTAGFSLYKLYEMLSQSYNTMKTLSSNNNRTKQENESLKSSTSIFIQVSALVALYITSLIKSFIAAGFKSNLKPRVAPNQADNFEWLTTDNAELSQLRNIDIAWKKSVEAAKTQVKILQAESNSQIATDLAGSKSPAPISSPEKLKQSFEEFRKTLDSALNFTYYYQEVLTKAYNDNKVAIESDETKAGQARAAFYKFEAALTELKQFDTEYGTLEKIIDNIQAIAIIYRDLEPDMQQVLNYNELGVGVPALIGYKGLIGKIDGILQQRILAQKKLQEEILLLQNSNDPRLLDYKNLGKEESTDPSKKLTLTAPSTEMQGEARDRKVSALKAQLAKMETEIAKIDGYKRKLLKGEISKFGGKSEKFIKVSDKPKSYDTEEFEFYDNLLGNPELVEPAGYGTILEDPEEYRNIPSTEVKPKFRKVNQV